MFRSRFALAVLVLFLATPSSAATLTVVNLNDTAPGSLRQATVDASPGDTINFAPGLTGTIPLSGSLLFTYKVTVLGPGASVISLSGQNSVRPISVTGGDVKIADLRLQSGFWPAGGACCYNADTLRLERCQIDGTNGEQGIYNTGVLELTDCTISSNQVQLGMVWSSGKATLTRCTLYGNRNTAIYSTGDITIESCTVDSNATSAGGGVSETK